MKNISKNIIKTILIIALFLIIINVNNIIFAAGVDGTTIVLNPGHGGEWTGCANGAKGLVEKDVNLKIANYLKEQLSKYYKVNIILTHDGVNFPNNDAGDLASRAMIARNNNADLYVSLHINDTTDHSKNGASVYVTSRTELPKYKEGMTKLGNLILDRLNALGIEKEAVYNNKLCNDREPKYQYYDGSQADYYGDIRHAMKGDTDDYGKDFSDGSGIPTVLIEHCYMNNSHDVQFLDSEDDLKRLAKADADAIVDYLGLRLNGEVIESIQVDKQNLNLLPNQTSKVNVTLAPTTAQNKKVKWESSNEEVAKVDNNGNITAIGEGTAQITITSLDNYNVYKIIEVNVEDYKVEFVKETEKTLVGREEILEVKITPTWIENKDIVWESSNEDIVEVTNKGYIKPKKEGKATIKVTWKSQNLSDEIEINVYDISDDIKIDINKYNIKDNYISKIGEKVTKNDFISNIILSEGLEAKIENIDEKQEYIGTGTKLKIIHKASGIEIEEYTCIIYGDVNGDGEINAIDLLKVRRYLLGKEKIDGIYYKTMNVYKDNDIDAMDLLKIRRYLLGKDSIEQ